MVAMGDGCLATVAMEGGGLKWLEPEPPPIILLNNIILCLIILILERIYELLSLFHRGEEGNNRKIFSSNEFQKIFCSQYLKNILTQFWKIFCLFAYFY